MFLPDVIEKVLFKVIFGLKFLRLLGVNTTTSLDGFALQINSIHEVKSQAG